MSGTDNLIIELPEMIAAIIFFITIATGITLVHNPDAIKSQMTTIEISAISSILPENSQVTLSLNEEFGVLEKEDKILIQINEYDSEIYMKEIPSSISLSKEGEKITIINS